MAALMTGAHRAAHKRRRAAQDRSGYRFYVADPVDLGAAANGGSLDPLPLPNNSRLGISFSVDTSSGDATISDGVNTYGLPDLVADVVFKLPHQFERSRSAVINNVTAPACQVTLYVLDEWTRPEEIAFGTFT